MCGRIRIWYCENITVTSGSSVTTMPTGHRPSVKFNSSGYSSDSNNALNPVTLSIDTDGVIKVFSLFGYFSGTVSGQIVYFV